MNTYVNMDGVENVAVALIKQARKDFVRGGKILYRMFRRIPDQKEFYASSKKDTRNENIRWMYDAWRFVQNDPYSMFGEVGEESIINQWKLESIIAYYKDLYMPGATILYEKKGSKEIYEIADITAIKRIGNKAIGSDFIAARNYIYSLPDGKHILDEWNRNAYERARKSKKSRPSINDTNYAKEKRAKRLTNIKRAKELRDAGKSVQEISEWMGLTMSCIRSYLRS